VARLRKLPDEEAFKLLEEYNIPIPAYSIVETPEEAGLAAEKIGFPVVIKVVSPDISHKSDVGGVVVGLNSALEVVEAARRMLERAKERAPSARITGILVQKMARPGVEVIIGGLRDPVFNVTLMFGLGGVFTELLRDVSFRVWPITERDAIEMINEIKGSPLLRGYRNIPPVDVKSLAEIVTKLGEIFEKHPELHSADLNPVIAYQEGALVVDARFIVRED
jgi:acetyl-CoA synthetase (ADP-forming)